MNISICITTYNRPELLKETLDSCFNQTYKPFEIIIGDDSKDDLTEKMINTLPKIEGVTINYNRHNPPLKQAENVNFVFKHATGNKLVLMHDDDLFVPDAIESLVDILNKDSTIKIAFGKSYVMSENGVIDYKDSEISSNYYYKNKKYNGSVLSPIEAGIIQQFPNNGYIIDAELARNIPWRTKTSYAKLGNGCEYDFGLRIGLTGAKMYFIDKYLVKYRDTEISFSSNSDSAYKSYVVLKNTKTAPKYNRIKNIALTRKVSLGLVQALKVGQFKDAIAMFFSKNHLKLWYSPGFYNRFIIICKYVLNNGVKNK
ncbi:glycosyltransferase family 2 protein [Maribacter sp. Asnod1-A12]|uniref:glycosyltransferase family 2 protein n=1 Tax=Maribacter sp. Asnod1-A12 TaxID=3160576 RepID=UPI00386A9A9F